MLSDGINNRLYNGKFKSAQRIIGDDITLTASERELINVLAEMFGDSGWIMGSMSVVISNALENIGVNFNEL